MATILVIDDSAAARRLMRDILQAAGHEVLEAEHGRRGLAVLANQPVDLIVTDIIMPELNGLEFIREMRSAHPQLQVIAVSSSRSIAGGPDYLAMAQKFGADYQLHKPFTAAELLALVEQALAAPRKEPA